MYDTYLIVIENFDVPYQYIDTDDDSASPMVDGSPWYCKSNCGWNSFINYNCVPGKVTPVMADYEGVHDDDDER